MAVKMFAPTGTTGIVQASGSQTTYTVAADGSISANPNDVAALLQAGFTQAARGGQGASGIGTLRPSLLTFKNTDGTTLAASPASGKFGITETFGTSEKLLSETANSNTKTDAAITEFTLPDSYVAGQDLTLSVNAVVSGTLTTKTVAADARKIADAGTEGSNLIATAAQVMSTTAADLTFVVTGTTLSPGDRVALKLTMVVTEGAAADQTGSINSVRLS